MIGFRLLLILMLSFRAVAQQYSSITVRVGGDVTLPCENGKDFQDNCQSTEWSFSVSGNMAAQPMFADGEEHKLTRAKPGRLSLSANCSVVIRKVTYEDVGRYTCRQFRGRQVVTDSLVDLSVIAMGIPASSPNITVAVGGEVTLPCKNGNDFRDKCPSTTWIFSDSKDETPLILFKNGRGGRGAPSRRLSVTADCALHIKKVTYKDAGRYTCRQLRSDRPLKDYHIDLFVLSTVHQDISDITVGVGGEVRLSCKNGKDFQNNCLGTTWLFTSSEGRHGATLLENGQILKSDRLSITADCSLVIKPVTSEDGGFYCCRQPLSGEYTDYVTNLIINSEDKPVDLTATNEATMTSNMAATTQRSTPEPKVETGCWVKFIVLLVGSAALSITALSVNIWTKRKDSKTAQGQAERNDIDDDVKYENDFPA